MSGLKTYIQEVSCQNTCYGYNSFSSQEIRLHIPATNICFPLHNFYQDIYIKTLAMRVNTLDLCTYSYSICFSFSFVFIFISQFTQDSYRNFIWLYFHIRNYWHKFFKTVKNITVSFFLEMFVHK